jgi:hypothetical protein
MEFVKLNGVLLFVREMLCVDERWKVEVRV